MSGVIRNFTKRYKTPQSAPITEQCRRVFIPDDPNIVAAFNELLSMLTNPDIWDDENGGLTADETAELLAVVWNNFRGDVCP